MRSIALAFALLGFPVAALAAEVARPFEQEFTCNDGESISNVTMHADGSMVVYPEGDSGWFPGRYELRPVGIFVSVPALAFEEISYETEVERGFLIAFRTPSVFCHATGHRRGDPAEGYFECPTIHHVPGVGYEQHAFEFSPSRMVKWTQWKEVTGVDTFRHQSWGIYFLESDRFSMAFGDREEQRFLTGRVVGDGFVVDQLEPERGPCREP